MRRAAPIRPPEGHVRWDAAAFRAYDAIVRAEWEATSGEVLAGLLALPVRKRVKAAAGMLDCLTDADLATYEERLRTDSRAEGDASAFAKGKGYYDSTVAAARKGIAFLRPGDTPPKGTLPKALHLAWVVFDEFAIVWPLEVAAKVYGYLKNRWRSSLVALPLAGASLGGAFLDDFASYASLPIHPAFVADFGTLGGVLLGILAAWLAGASRLGRLSDAERQAETGSFAVWSGLSLAVAAWAASWGLFAWPVPQMAWTLGIAGMSAVAWGVATLIDAGSKKK